MSSSQRRFVGQTVLVTGASLGVGRAVAHAFHAEGANVVMVARRLGPLEEAAKGLERAACIAADVADVGALGGLVDACVARFGGLDGLVNNAGLHSRGPVERNAAEDLAAMVDVNLRAPIVLTRLALPQLLARRGFVVQVASLAGKVPLEGAATYSATKFGLRAFSIALAQEVSERGVRACLVSPGPIDTGFIMDELDRVEDIVFSQAMCTADDVARMVLDCAEDGQIERQYPESGGRLATLGYLMPGLRRRLKPLLEARGRAVKERLRRERRG
ncbi:MAG: SDR family NAD(P)-dependent oxidoreductase [Polyangiaceae bacterium]|jgi:short-subunit dehydrogenase|nr:SDR family NAD(P)-dependent oxidoreductase [Polyangiaceae bacterium]MBK8941371.1 SDR family NAD(P)-dependent oxidoreductase [Polyangiaceae bacterium]